MNANTDTLERRNTSEERIAQSEERSGKCRALAAYHDLLASFDWQFAFADERARWKSGLAALDRLTILQLEVDPTGDIWMSYPGAQQQGAPHPVVKGGAA